MAIPHIEQPEFIEIDSGLRLRKYTDDCAFALEWYQDSETVWLVDGVPEPYTKEKLYRMYHYLRDHGELYFIEVKNHGGNDFSPIGDVTFWQEDMPIVIGQKDLRGRGIGRKVVKALVERGRQLGYPYLEISEIYDYNVGSRKLFESLGFQAVKKTPKGHSYRLQLD